MEYFFADYNWIENQISSYERALNALGVTHVCYISRGGMFPAFLAAYMLGIGQIHPLFYDRQSRTVAFPDEALIGPDSVVLLCEDKCGEGYTMQDCLAHAKRLTPHIKTLVVYYFKGSRIQPDFGLYVGDTMVVLPWERYVWTPEFNQDYNQGRIKQEGLDKVYLKYGAELDHIFIARHKDSNFPNLSEDILSGGLGPSSCPPIAPPQQNYRGWIVVSSRPENHRDSIEHWLLMHNIALDKLLLRDDSRFSIKASDGPYEKAEIAAKSKAAHIRAEGITHFYEPDLLQTSFIAALVPLTRVYWWNHHLKIAKLISVHHHV